jgi:hypothetical protein
MIYLKKKEVQFLELNDALRYFEASEEITIRKYFKLMTVTCPDLVRKYSKIDIETYPPDSSQISQDKNVIFHNTITLLKIIEGFTDRITKKLITLLTSKEMPLEKDYVISIKKYLEQENSSRKEAKDIAQYLLLTKDNPNTIASGTMLLMEYSSNLLIGIHNYFLDSFEKIANNISDQNILELGEIEMVRISNLSPTQLGLLSSLLQHSNDIEIGFKNLKKTELDGMFSKFLIFKDMPVSANTLKKKGYFGRDTEERDIDAIEKFWVYVE